MSLSRSYCNTNIKMEDLIQGKQKQTFVEGLRKSASTNEGKIHVIPVKDKWAIKVEGSNRYYRILNSKKEAINLAKARSYQTGSYTVIIHNNDGKISDMRSYM